MSTPDGVDVDVPRRPQDRLFPTDTIRLTPEMYGDLRTAIERTMDKVYNDWEVAGRVPEPQVLPLRQRDITPAMYDALQAAFHEAEALDRRLWRELTNLKAENAQLRHQIELLKGGS